MSLETYVRDVLPAVNQAILDNDYPRFDSFFAADIEDDELESRWPEISREHSDELGKLVSFTKIEEKTESSGDTRLTFHGVFEKDTAVIMVLVRQSEGHCELLEHTYTWE